MSTTTLAPGGATQPPGHFDISNTPPIPFLRLVSVELRKLFDTRAGRWLIISMLGLIVLASAIVMIVSLNNDSRLNLNDMSSVSGGVFNILLPVLGIMAVTTEWSQRTNMVTFTLEPRRPRVIAAKLVASVVIAVASIIVALIIGAALGGIFQIAGGDFDWGTMEVLDIVGFALVQSIALLTGFAFATLLLNTPAAIVVYFAYIFVIPTLIIWGSLTIGWFEDVAPWIDFSTAQVPLFAGFEDMEWGHFAVSGLIWFVLPLTLGITRMLRAEIK